MDTQKKFNLSDVLCAISPGDNNTDVLNIQWNLVIKRSDIT